MSVSPTAEGVARRRNVLLKATLFAGEAVHPVVIKNISATGARVACKVHLTDDLEVVLKKRPIFAAGRIVWSKRGEIGLQFYRPLAKCHLNFTAD